MRAQILLAAKDLLKSTEASVVKPDRYKMISANTNVLTSLKDKITLIISELEIDQIKSVESHHQVTPYTQYLDSVKTMKLTQSLKELYNKETSYNIEEKPQLVISDGVISRFSDTQNAEKSILTYCKDQLDILKKIQHRTNQLAFVEYSIQVLDSLPFVDDIFWVNEPYTKLSLLEKQELLDNISQIMNIFTQSVFHLQRMQTKNTDIQLQRFYNTVTATYLLIFNLVDQEDELGSYHEVKIDVNLFEKRLHDAKNIIIDKIVLDRANKIRGYIEALDSNRSSTIFNFKLNADTWYESDDANFIMKYMK